MLATHVSADTRLIYDSGDGYKVSIEVEPENFRIIITGSKGENRANMDFGRTEIPLPKPYKESLRKMGADPDNYAYFGGSLLIRRAALPALLTEYETWKEAYRARILSKPEIHRCERCSEKIEGEPVWNKERFRGLPVQTPYCQPCARLLRIFAGGIGVDGEPLTAREDDRAPYTKGDF